MPPLKKEKIFMTGSTIFAGDKFLPYDKFSVQIYGEIQARAEKEGKSLPSYDFQLAATAISRGMVLVTHKAADFLSLQESAFLRLEDWFTA